MQFQDLFISEETKLLFESIDTDTYMGEVKFENTINRVTSVAMPRQIERVPAGTKFAFKLVYTIIDKDEAEEDLGILRKGLELLQLDYLGGHGTRGYGRISIDNVTIQTFFVDDELSKRCEQVLQG